MDITQIIPNTVKVFTSNSLARKMQELPCVDEEKYKLLHKRFLTPLDIKINVDQFIKEIEYYNSFFQPWGNNTLTRYGLPLVNYNGKYDNELDPTNNSLTDWNKKNPDNQLIETDFRTTTDVLNLSSLKSLRVFDGTWCRSNILKWNNGAGFKPHIDAIIPCHWLRLWGTTSAKSFELGYYKDNEWVVVQDIEPGRIYLIDTVLIHKAKSTSDETIYQFFISVDPSAINLIERLIC
jgi:hypothetical protein